jgi:hypothetical protein
VLRRSPLYSALFLVFFLVLTAFQFTEKLGFSRKVGNFTIKGEVRKTGEGVSSGKNEILIGQTASVTFGGLEFYLSEADRGVFLNEGEENSQMLSVEMLRLSGDSAHFLLSDGAELTFYAQKTDAGDGLLISGRLPDRAESLAIPFRVLQGAKVSGDSHGSITVQQGDVSYGFDRSISMQTSDNRAPRENILELRKEDPVIFYRVSPPETAFDAAAFVARGAMEKNTFDEALGQWAENVYGIWEKSMANAGTEELTAAFIAESARRGAYAAALNSVPDAFKASGARTFRLSPFIGRLEATLRSLSTFERSERERLSRLFREDTSQFFMRDGGYSEVPIGFDALGSSEEAGFAKNTKPEAILLSDAIWIFQGFSRWALVAGGGTNPYEHLQSRALELVARNLRKDGARGIVLVAGERTQAPKNARAETAVDHNEEAERAEIEGNIMLGKALAAYGEAAGNSSWAAVGRSLILSALNLMRQDGKCPKSVSITADLAIEDEPDGEVFGSEKLYAALNLSPFYPHSVNLGKIKKDVWVWSMAEDITAVNTNSIFEIQVKFRPLWAHYLIIRGVEPFVKIQLRDMDYRSDHRFEQWNAPGWVYNSAEKTLLVKMVHRDEIENIKIFYAN